jgi:acetylornithine deacetylase/succinyl-diaminopimelate desuccinylase-like protein
LSKLNLHVDSSSDDIIADLKLIIRQPSVSAVKQGLVECANVVASIMSKAGIATEIMHLYNKREGIDSDSDAESDSDADSDVPPPLVHGEVKSKANPNGMTILFYNHYDVQPVDPIELWNADPFSGRVEDNYIYGRGAADDKGELITRIKAVEYYLKKTGDVPCNIKFLIEGEEEIGSLHLKEYLTVYKEKFECDAVIWEGGFIDSKERPIISLGQKGILSVELVAKGQSRDAHSSLAVLIDNPAWHLIRALNTMRDKNGRILIMDWYNEVRGFTSEELSMIENELFDENALKKEHGIESFLNNATDFEAKKAFEGAPSCNICGLVAGYTDEGAKTVLPSKAIAKLDFRLIPDMIPEMQFERLKKHLQQQGYGNLKDDGRNGNGTNMEIKFLDGEPAARTAINHPFVNIVKEAAIEIYGGAIINVSSAGTGPMYYFHDILKVPCVCVGGTDIFNRVHSPNGFMRIDRLIKTIKWIAAILEKARY